MKCFSVEDGEGIAMLTKANVSKSTTSGNISGEKYCIEVTDGFESCGWIFNGYTQAESKFLELAKSGKNLETLMSEADWCFDSGYEILEEDCDESFEENGQVM